MHMLLSVSKGFLKIVRLRLQDYIQRLMAEKADLDKRFHGMKDELITRLQNACAQRDEARAQVSCHAIRAKGSVGKFAGVTFLLRRPEQ